MGVGLIIPHHPPMLLVILSTPVFFGVIAAVTPPARVCLIRGMDGLVKWVCDVCLVTSSTLLFAINIWLMMI